MTTRPALSEETKARLRGLHPRVGRLSLSLDPDLAAWLRAVAAAADVPVSRVVELAIRDRMDADQ